MCNCFQSICVSFRDSARKRNTYVITTWSFSMPDSAVAGLKLQQPKSCKILYETHWQTGNVQDAGMQCRVSIGARGRMERKSLRRWMRCRKVSICALPTAFVTSSVLYLHINTHSHLDLYKSGAQVTAGGEVVNRSLALRHRHNCATSSTNTINLK